MSTINFNDGTWETVGYKITKRGRKPKGGNKVAKELKWPSWCGEDSGCEEPSGKPCRHLEPNGNCDVVPVPKEPKAKRNKLYFIQLRDDDDNGCIIVSARTIKEAKKHSMDAFVSTFCSVLGELPYYSWIDIQAKAIKCGQSFYDEVDEGTIRNFEIIGKGFVYTDKKTGSVSWYNFIAELEEKKRIKWEEPTED